MLSLPYMHAGECASSVESANVRPRTNIDMVADLLESVNGRRNLHSRPKEALHQTFY